MSLSHYFLSLCFPFFPFHTAVLLETCCDSSRPHSYDKETQVTFTPTEKQNSNFLENFKIHLNIEKAVGLAELSLIILEISP